MGCLRGIVYLIVGLVFVAVSVVILIAVYEEPSTGTRCTMLGETVVRKQDGVKLQCIKNVNTGTLFWRKIEER